ncbi:SCP2 sterol-binding domain-containing protein [Micromonospora sp. RTP1Z1]|uniref:SCP2 sterol-binding domain-containing protein n=1 Tax=Micromonospora sp. RTP1Z1 TaxID=2994043 RepID=UPI0029C67E00|nr:SCP2 sterol-binding domain-containing protein [Micromonospora sp. RTP1Z1]
MSDPTAEFFDGLGRRGHEPLLQEATGTIRFDLEHDHGIDHWLVTINNGDIQVSREDREADSVVRADKGLFDRIVSGGENLYAAWVRNELRAVGDIRLARFIQRVFPGPPGAHHPRMFASERRRQG